MIFVNSNPSQTWKNGSEPILPIFNCTFHEKGANPYENRKNNIKKPIAQWFPEMVSIFKIGRAHV